MGFGFRKRLRIFPGLWLNLSKKGGSLSVGGRGATLRMHGVSWWMNELPYPNDLTAAQWALIERLLPAPKPKGRKLPFPRPAISSA